MPKAHLTRGEHVVSAGALPDLLPRMRKSMTPEDLTNRFTYHAPKPGQPELYQQIRDEAKTLAETVDQACPDSREKALAITKLEESVFWANASIARNA